MSPQEYSTGVPQGDGEDAPWHELDAHQWRARVAERSAVEGVRAALERIEEREAFINAFSQVFAEEALQEAAELDQLDASERGALHGVPVAIKEELDVAGAVTTFGTRANHTPKSKDSLVVARLRAAGAIIIGKTHMPEFGAYPLTSSQGYGVTRNPIDLSRTPGGSSGGSAAAVAAGMVPIAMGGDGGGSVRIPAAMCGLVGLKPGRGVLPTAPYTDLWKSLGTSGPMARTVDDVELMLSVLRDEDLVPSGSGGASWERATLDPVEQRGRDFSERPWQVAWLERSSTPFIPVRAANRQARKRAAAQLEAQGAQLRPLSARLPDPTLPFLILMFAGIRSEIELLDNPDRIEKRHRLTKLVGALMRPSLVSWAERKAAAIGKKVSDMMAREGIDAILTPTVADRPRRADLLVGKGAIRASLLSMPSIAYTAMWNVAGQPALAVPMGQGSDGLPTSVQLVGHVGSKKKLLDLARELD